WALDNVSFELRRGEALGLVGKNGSGKSTLLRIIAGLIKPDCGTVDIQGRVAPLIALGAGFNPILTGRENIYANMAILGLSKPEIDERFDDVVEFAEIGEAIDAPVQTYSSGMAARLGFASAIHTEPDILLIDEVLAVGDIKFRAKCYRKLEELRRKQVSIIMVSHDPEAIYATCDSGCYLNKGSFLASGSIELIMRRYEEELFGILKLESEQIPSNSLETNIGSDYININSIFFKDFSSKPIQELVSGEPARLCIVLNVNKSLQDISIRVLISDRLGDALFLDSKRDLVSWNFDVGKYEIHLDLNVIGLKPGYYTMNTWIMATKLSVIDVFAGFKFKVQPHPTINDSIRCRYFQPRTWKLNEFSK
ncbi:MAG: ABC transporter ATP-binding protein, partial [Xenococcus sp. (in: cyanobacteria)]